MDGLAIRALQRDLVGGAVVVLDGATGTEIECRDAR